VRTAFVCFFGNVHQYLSTYVQGWQEGHFPSLVLSSMSSFTALLDLDYCLVFHPWFDFSQGCWSRSCLLVRD